jgi:hypothetical protein
VKLAAHYRHRQVTWLEIKLRIRRTLYFVSSVLQPVSRIIKEAELSAIGKEFQAEAQWKDRSANEVQISFNSSGLYLLEYIVVLLAQVRIKLRSQNFLGE